MVLSEIFRDARRIAKGAAELRVGRTSDPVRRRLEHEFALGLPFLSVVYRTRDILEADRVEMDLLAFLRSKTRKVVNHSKDYGGNGPYSKKIHAVYIAWRPKNTW